MQQHIVTAFADELEQLSASLLQMGGFAEAMIQDATRAIAGRDVQLAQTVIDRDIELDRLEQGVERMVVRMLALRQPMAADLRNVIGAIKVADAIERIGDLAADICRRCEYLAGDDNRSALRGIERMGHAVLHQLKTTLDAFAHRDAVRAMQVVTGDDDIDSYYEGLLRSLLDYMVVDPEQVQIRANYLFLVKNFERIGDLCTNISKTVYFIATGEQAGTRGLRAEREAET